MADLISITSGDLTARINPLGAELWSLTDSVGREYMTDADPVFWTGHAPLLFPIVGALNGGRYRLDDETYDLPRHGFARHSPFQLLVHLEDSAIFGFGHNEATRAVFPFNFALEMSFHLLGWRLEMTLEVLNLGDTPLPFSFGFHPAFAWPLPGGAPKDAHRVTFAQPESQPIRRIDPASGLILPERRPTPVKARSFKPTAALFEADVLIWDDLNSRALNFGAPGGASLDISFSDLPMLGIWQKPEANYLCIEPWHGLADPLGYAGDFRAKPGVLSLPPREERSFRMDVTVNPR